MQHDMAPIISYVNYFKHIFVIILSKAWLSNFETNVYRIILNFHFQSTFKLFYCPYYCLGHLFVSTAFEK